MANPTPPVSTELGLQPIDEKYYRPDLELLDRYTAFSAELVRIALIGVAGIGVYLKELMMPVADGEPRLVPLPPPSWFGVLLGTACLLLCVAAACGLFHRFYAADGIFHHLKAARRLGRVDPAPKIDAETGAAKRRYSLAACWLVSSELAIVAGIAMAGVAFGVRLWVVAGGQEAVAPWAGGALVLFAAGAAAIMRWVEHFKKYGWGADSRLIRAARWIKKRLKSWRVVDGTPRDRAS